MHRYALILAGGSGTRLWPMSRESLPKQLLPLFGGRSLLQLAFARQEGLAPAEQRYICAGERHRAAILAGLPQLPAEQFLGEPTGRDTLAAIGLGTAVLAARDPAAVVGFFPADHLIEPVDEYRRIVEQGFRVAEENADTLVTFGIAPSGPATGFGYLELGDALDQRARGTDTREGDSPVFADTKTGTVPAQLVRQFVEKPPREKAEEYFHAGPRKYLWNSGMFVWRAATLLDCIRRFEPAVYDGLQTIARDWATPRRAATLAAIFPTLRKISIDFAVMEPASRDARFRVAAVPMPLRWLDVGSWPAYAETCPRDDRGNAAVGENLLLESTGCLVVSSDPQHLVAAIGCEDLIVVHTADATLVCRKDRAEQIKELYKQLSPQRQ